MLAFVLVLGYLAGSIPFSLLLGLAAGRDIRAHGSGNVGATNVWRTCGWKWGTAAFALDFLKGLVPVVCAWRIGEIWPPLPYPPMLAGATAVLGHLFPVWLKFRGGKGVATSAGLMAGLMWQPFLAALAVFVATVALSRYISLGSMLGSAALAAASLLLLPDPLGADLPLVAAAVVLAVLIIVRHHANIARIRAGTENRFPPPRK